MLGFDNRFESLKARFASGPPSFLGFAVAVWGPPGTPSGFLLAIVKFVIARNTAQRDLSL